ncbi:MAG: twin-arginine translocase subunit TatC, partial [Phycisphaerae bacterium]
STMSLEEHLEELRRRLIYGLAGLGVCTIFCLIFGSHLVQYLQQPYRVIEPDKPLTALAPADAFIGYMKVSLIAGIIVSSPWIFYHLWKFVAAGLYKKEKHYVLIAVPFSTALFIIGALFFFYVVAPITLRFFLKFGDIVGVMPAWTFQKYISFMTILMLVFGLAFQTPAAILILNLTGLVSITALKKYRKYVFLAMFVIAATATPPDVISQIMLGLPLYALYELGILLCYIKSSYKAADK